MRSDPQPSTGAHFAVPLKLFYAALFIALGVQLPFLPVWLAAKGLDPQAIGVVLAVPMIVRLVAIPVATRAADRRDALRAVLVMVTAAGVAGYGALAFAEGFAAIAAGYALASAAYTPVMMLTDTYALRGLPAFGRAYGPVRLWGSAAFIAASFGAGRVLDAIAPRDLIWLIVAAMALAAVCARALAPLPPSAATSTAVKPSGRPLLRE